MAIYFGKLIIYVGSDRVDEKNIDGTNMEQIILSAKQLRTDVQKMVTYKQNQGLYPGKRSKDLKVAIKLQGKFSNEEWKSFNQAVNRGK